MKRPVILYFVESNAPTAEDIEAAKKIDADVKFRNASAVPAEEHSLEICDGVAGHVPEIYANKFPKAEVAISNYNKSLEDLTAKTGDSKPPKPKTAEQLAAEAEKAEINKLKKHLGLNNIKFEKNATLEELKALNSQLSTEVDSSAPANASTAWVPNAQ